MLYPTYRFGRGDPFAVMRRMMQDLDGGLAARPGATPFPPINLWQGGDAVTICAELPGVEAGDIAITVKDNVLTISGERKAPRAAEDATWHRRERGFGTFSRAIRLPFASAAGEVEARFANGVLQVVVGRPEEEKPRRIEIKAA